MNVSTMDLAIKNNVLLHHKLIQLTQTAKIILTVVHYQIQRKVVWIYQ